MKQALADCPVLRCWWTKRELEKFDAPVAWVLEHRPKTKEAVERIRLFRTGKSRSPNARELAEEIVRTVNGYGINYPELTCEQELEALRLATETLAGECPLG